MCHSAPVTTTTPAARPTAPGRQVWFVLGLLALAVQLWSLYTPNPPGGVTFPHADKVVHVLLFAVPVACFCRAASRPLLVAGIFALHAVLSELVQYHWVSGRSGSPADAVADMLGVGAGWLWAAWPPGRTQHRRDEA